MVRLTFLLILASVTSGFCYAQSQVPQGQATPTLPLRGTVETAKGEVLGNIQITVNDANGDRRLSTVTDSTGQFTVRVPAGRYTVTATAQGFGETTETVNVRPNQPATVRLVLGGPVPNGEATNHGDPQAASKPVAQGLPGDVPIPSSGAITVTGQFRSWAELAGWLNAQAARNIRLEAILITGGNKNLFVWISHTGMDQHIVVPATQISTPSDLQSILTAYPQAAVIGFVGINHDRYLVLRSNP